MTWTAISSGSSTGGESPRRDGCRWPSAKRDLDDARSPVCAPVVVWLDLGGMYSVASHAESDGRPEPRRSSHPSGSQFGRTARSPPLPRPAARSCCGRPSAWRRRRSGTASCAGLGEDDRRVPGRVGLHRRVDLVLAGGGHVALADDRRTGDPGRAERRLHLEPGTARAHRAVAGRLHRRRQLTPDGAADERVCCIRSSPESSVLLAPFCGAGGGMA